MESKVIWPSWELKVAPQNEQLPDLSSWHPGSDLCVQSEDLPTCIRFYLAKNKAKSNQTIIMLSFDDSNYLISNCGKHVKMERFCKVQMNSVEEVQNNLKFSKS